MSSAVKPVLRGFLDRRIRKDVLISVGLGITFAYAHHVLWVEASRKKYAEFHKNYDGDAHFEFMRQKGYLQSARPDGEEPIDYDGF